MDFRSILYLRDTFVVPSNVDSIITVELRFVNAKYSVLDRRRFATAIEIYIGVTFRRFPKNPKENFVPSGTVEMIHFEKKLLFSLDQRTKLNY